jgi:hypothetical protein
MTTQGCDTSVHTSPVKRRAHSVITFALKLSVFSLISISAFAAAGACPSGLPVSGNNCYFIAANGADTNSGTSESSPWLHAPGMPSCTGNCATVTPGPGNGFIFRGGDTWHFGASTSPSTGGTWDWGSQGWNGTSSNPIYVGVSSSWYNSAICGSSWCRPILNADNPSSSSPVSSCAYQIGSNNDMVSFANISYLAFDNFEMTGLCQNDTNDPWAHDIYLSESAGSNNIYEHLYIHGWTALPFSCSGGVGHCFNLFAFEGSNNPGDLHLQDIVDGSDSVPGELGVMFGGGYNISQCVFRYASQIVTTDGHLIHDTLFDHWYEPGDNDAHGNLYEESGSDSSSVHAYYDNVFSNVCTDPGSCPNGIVGIWPQPTTSTTDYFFNNLIYNTKTSGNYFDIGQNGSSQGPIVLFNNTFEATDNGVILQCNSSSSHPFTDTNNHYITDAGSQYSSPCNGKTTVTSLLQTHSTANSQGYTASETYAYSPVSANGSTVGTGTNEQSYCAALSAAGFSDAATACQSDTRYACVYNTGNHSVSCPARTTVARPTSGAWDIGTYQYLAQDPPGPPSNLTATPQ